MKTDSYIGVKETKSRFLSLSLPLERKLGKVHSVFKTSFNVVIDGHLYNFSQQGMSLSAHGCMLDQEAMSQLLHRCKPGDLVKSQEGVFSFYTDNGVLKVDVSKMKEIDLAIPHLEYDRKKLVQAPILSVLQSIAFENQIGLEQTRELEKACLVLVNFSKQTEEERESLFDYFIGRGKGLTPSGDDILVGFTMIRKAFDAASVFEQRFKRKTVTRQTTDISKAYFHALFEGHVSSLFLALIYSIEEISQKNIKELTDRITMYGHTSGYDTLFGFYLGLQSLINENGE